MVVPLRLLHWSLECGASKDIHYYLTSARLVRIGYVSTGIAAVNREPMRMGCVRFWHLESMETPITHCVITRNPLVAIEQLSK